VAAFIIYSFTEINIKDEPKGPCAPAVHDDYIQRIPVD
jgi:hypothetical protein